MTTNTTREPTDLSSFDILNMFRARLYLSRTRLIAEAVTAIKDNTGLLSWIEFPPWFHSHLIKVALACIGITPLTSESSSMVKKTLFVFILELLNAETDGAESYFSAIPKLRVAKKNPAHKYLSSQLSKQEYIPMEDELDSSALSTSLPVSKSTAALETTAPALPQAPKPDPPPCTHSPLPEESTVLRPETALADTPPQSQQTPQTTEVEIPFSASLEDQCRMLLQKEHMAVKWMFTRTGRFKMDTLQQKCEDCPNRATGVKIHGRHQPIYYPKCRSHANAETFEFSSTFEDWINSHFPFPAHPPE